MGFLPGGARISSDPLSTHEVHPRMEDSSSFAGDGFAAFLSTVSLLAGVFFCACIVTFYSGRRGRPLVAALFPAIPLILTTISMQVIPVVLMLLNGFNGIATEKTSGPIEVFNFVIKSQQFLLWRVVEAAVCIAIVAMVQFARTARAMDAEPPVADASGPAAPGPKPVLNWITASLVFLIIVSTAYLVRGCSEINSLIALLMDTAKSAEVNARIGNMSIAAVSSYISRHLIFFAMASLNVILGSIALGVYTVEDVRPRRYDAPVSALLALVVLGLCVANIASNVRTLKYLRSQMISGGGIPPSWKVGLVPFVELESVSPYADSMGTQSDHSSGSELH